MNRRRVLTLVGTVGVTGLAGCLGDEGTFEYTASAAEIPEGSRNGYQAEGPEAIDINETIEAAGISREVNITTWSSTYTSPDNEASLFLFSTPDVTVAGQSLNPLARLSGADLIARVIDEGLARTGGEANIKEIETNGELELMALGDQRTASIFTAVLEAEGEELPIRLYLLSITHGEDVVLAVGFHPEEFDASSDLQSLMESIEHPVDVE
jgi:hypothetical protein